MTRKYFSKPLHPRDDPEKQSKTLRRCYELLTLTSRSFARVIVELNPELRDTIALFYLILRALDTIEDDMTISPDVKIPLLRTFDEKLDLNDWTFNGNGPNEKDRVVLVEFDAVLTEYHLLKPEYQEVLKDITHKMGNGMADYVVNEDFNLNGVKTIADYDLYCHYVAGLVGEGLTKLIIIAKFGDETLVSNPNLQESMGLFLQKTNIIRDYREDIDDGRSFWPEEVWSKYSKGSLKDFTKSPEDLQQGLYCVSELVANSLDHVCDCLLFLSCVKDPSTYNFCCIPQIMAISTLDLVYRNPDIFEKNVKIRRGTTASLILQGQDLKGTCDIFRYFVRRIHHRSTPDDPSYLRIGIVCGKIEQYIEKLFPVSVPEKKFDLNGPSQRELARQRKVKRENGNEGIYLFVFASVTLFGLGGLMVGVAYLCGADFSQVHKEVLGAVETLWNFDPATVSAVKSSTASIVDSATSSAISAANSAVEAVKAAHDEL